MKTIKFLQNNEPASAPPPARFLPLISSPTKVELSHDAVALQAYLIYMAEGRPQGRALQHWLEAETRVSSTRGPMMDPLRSSNNGSIPIDAAR